MNFLSTQSNESRRNYSKYLKVLGSFSKLYSSSEKPYIQYRVAENTFCKAFDAENLARADVAYDAIKDGYGIGIKTFILAGGSKIEKIAEFNSHSAELRKHKGLDLAYKLAEFRNERILLADRNYNVSKRIYHIVGRDDFKIKVFEESYDLIDIETIEIISDNKSAFKFKDKNHEYSFNYSKSVLMKRFVVPNDYIEIDVDIIDSPIENLLNMRSYNTILANEPKSEYSIKKISNLETEELCPGIDYVMLPLYSPKAKEKNKEPIIPISSQLNQWNAKGRIRKPGEVYIHIPIEIHKYCPGFFPTKDISFNLKIPNGEVLSAKLCQENAKALMTNPNNAMSDWILRRVLNLKERELLTYSKLIKSGYDAVKITKIDNSNFLIDFAIIDSFENFMSTFIQ